jgi:hypothetical protein
MEFDSFVTHQIDLYMGKPKSGKTLIAGSYPKPMLYVSVGDDGGGRVLAMAYKDDIEKGLIKTKNLRNDQPVNGKIKKTSIDKLADLLWELKQPGAPKFKTIVIDTIGALQDDYKAYMEYAKNGKQLSTNEWGDVSKMVLGIKDIMKRFSEDMQVQFVWVSHVKEMEMYETSGLNKELRIIPDLTKNSGTKYMKDASNIFYCCRKTVLDNKGQKTVKFLVYVGPHPLIDTGTRDIALKVGDFVEDFTYDKWQQLVKAGRLDHLEIVVPEVEESEEENKSEE